MNQASIKNIVVCGAGTMGCGIAQVVAQNGFNTILYDVQLSMLEKAAVTIRKNLNAMVEKGKIEDDERNTILTRLKYTNNANIICIPARFVAFEYARQMVELFMETQFEGGRHQLRIDKIPC